jgi:hypothetical protein
MCSWDVAAEKGRSSLTLLGIEDGGHPQAPAKGAHEVDVSSWDVAAEKGRSSLTLLGIEDGGHPQAPAKGAHEVDVSSWDVAAEKGRSSLTLTLSPRGEGIEMGEAMDVRGAKERPR